jgi:hypothetical protein
MNQTINIITRIRGDTWIKEWYIFNEDGEKANLINSSVKLVLRDKNDALVFEANNTNNGFTINANTARVRMVCNSATMNLTPNSYYYDVEIRFSNNVVRTIEQAKLIITKQYAT